MTGSVAPTLPTKGDTRPTSDARTRGSLVTLRDALNELLDSENKILSSALGKEVVTAAKLAKGLGAIQWYTPKVIPTEESRSNVAFGTLTTADEIKEVVVAENALVVVGYSALVKSSVSAAGKMALFLGANQLKQIGTTTPEVQEATTVSTALGNCSTGARGLGYTGVGTSYVTTGMVLGNGTEGNQGGFTIVQRLAAGTYNISVQYKATSGSVTAKERDLWVMTVG
jgi:hypothetical protein